MAPGAQNQQQPTKNFSGNGVSVAAMCAESSEEWVRIRLMDLADSPYSTTSQKISALEYLGKNLGMF